MSPASSSRGLAKLRMPSAAETRLLKGYGPLAVLLVAFLLMALLVPTKAPQREVIHETRTVDQQVAGSGTTSGGGGTTVTTPSSVTTPGSVASGGSGTGGSSATGTTAPCPGRDLQVPGDPYSPPCVAFSGNNGGSTSPGVSTSTITVSYRVTADAESFQQQLAAIGGAQFSDTTADIEKTVTNLATYFNEHFQFYGRKIKVVFFNGQGSITNELLGEGQQQADADAITSAQSIHAFAELNGVTEPYDDALYQQHVIAFGAPYLSAQWMAQRAPYEWSTQTECNDVVSTTSELYLKEMAGKAAQWAAGSLQGQPRKTAIIAPNNPWYQECAQAAVAEDAQAGYPVTDSVSYALDLSTLSSQAASVISKLANDNVTTVFCGCDPIFPVYLTSRAAEQNYYPEWVVAGVALTDTDLVGQLFQQSEWSHAFGVSYAGPTLPKQASLGYAAYKTVASDEPANAVPGIYEQMYEMAIGLQMAGPDLTPANFEAGMRKYPGSVPNAPNSQYGTWGFPAGHYTPQLDSVIISWDPNKISNYNGQPGAYIIDSPRYRSGQYPTGNPALPSNFPDPPQNSNSS